ncbi:prenyltransferase [Leptospira fletcheri]|uniref:Prenyltransferase n=1 Tax=Leptospira fletcheri TaxID=2484981 RepID=A0A4R9G538_9LEPT|nr:prenyltransferase [Leptospira fletcheri]TGK06481.1 prenyltransferase [Leptospira fletcheri]
MFPSNKKDLWFYIHVLSLDICLGVSGSGAYAATVTGAKMKWAWWLLLPLSVWVVYTVDHLLDGWRIGTDSVNPRHSFHHKHAKILMFFAGSGIVVCGAVSFLFLREIVFIGGLVLAFAALGHLLLAAWGGIRMGKEFSVAFIYTLGVWFGPIAVVGFRSWTVVLLLSLFFGGTVLNLIMNSLMEAELDEKEGQSYLLRIFSREKVRDWVLRFSLLGTLSSVLLAGWTKRFEPKESAVACLFAAALCAVPGIILRFSEFFSGSQRYRLLGEGIYVLGFLPWLVHW